MMLTVNILKYITLLVVKPFWLGLLFVVLMVLFFWTIYYFRRTSSETEQSKKQKFRSADDIDSGSEKINIAKEEKLYNSHLRHEPKEPVLIPEENLDEEEGQ